jgi:iron(III) transport system permease protein
MTTRATELDTREPLDDGSATGASRPTGVARPRKSPPRWLAPFLTPRGALTTILFLVLAYLVLPPVVVMVWKSFVSGISLDGATGFDAYKTIAGADLGAAALDTLEFAVGSTIVSLVIGTLLAWTAARTDAPARSLAYVVAFLGLAVPGIVNVVGWILLFGNGKGQGDAVLSSWFGHTISIGVESVPGMIFVESLLSIPIVFFLMVGPLQNFNSALEEAASVYGARNWVVTWKITAPLMIPTLTSAILLIVIRSVQAFEVPVLLGIPAGTHIFTAELYQTLHGSLLPDYSSAAAYGTILVIALMILVLLENRLTRDARRYAVVTGKSNVHTRRKLHRTKYLPLVLNIVLLICYLLPTIYLLYSSFEPNLSGKLSPGFTKAVIDTLIVAACTAILVVLITLTSAWVSARATHLPARLVTLLANAPLVVPGVVFGFGFLLFYLYSPIPLFGTLFGIILAFVTLYLPYGMRSLRPAIIGISSELEEAARVSGAKERAVARRILLPLVKPSATGTSLFVFFNAFRELAVAALLITAATPMLSTQLLDALVNGNLNIVSALGTFIMAVTVIVGAIAFRTIGFRRGAGQLTKGVG